MKTVALLLIFIFLSGTGPKNQLPEVYSALSRIPNEEWQTVAYTDFVSLMEAQGEIWPPAESELNQKQQKAWNNAWQPHFLTSDLTRLGFSPYQITQVVEARRESDFILWVEGTFNTLDVALALPALGYEMLPEFPTEAYRANQSEWRGLMPYIALPGQNILLIASSEANLQTMLTIYDGHMLPIVEQDNLLVLLGEISLKVSSSVLRFDSSSPNCPANSSHLVSHGLRYNNETSTWEYVLNLGYPTAIPLANARYLTERLEYSTLRPSFYNGVVGQHTYVLDQRLYEGAGGSILQFVMQLRPDFEALPFDLAEQTNVCAIFSAPDAAAISLALTRIQDLGAARADGTIRYGNVEQALYNAGLNNAHINPTQILTPPQEAALNSTWRTDLAFENEFEGWFGFSPDDIRQVVEMGFSIGDYERIIWGDFTTAQVESALKNNGYVAVEQYNGTRVFILREVPVSGFLLDRLAKIVASPADGILVLSNTLINLHLLMDVLRGEVRSTLPFSRDLLLTTRALQDATNVIIHRFINPRSGGLVCGLPNYRVEAFANVLRPDGWHFLYALGFSGARQDGEEIATDLAETLENSDHPLQGPGSTTIGELATVVDTRTIAENDATVVVVEMRVDTTDQQASFFGQDFAQANLPPCALGDINR